MKTPFSSTPYIATISHKRNFIVSLTNADGVAVTDHDQKANLLWAAFKHRLGNSEFTNINMAYNLNTLLSLHNLEQLDSMVCY